MLSACFLYLFSSDYRTHSDVGANYYPHFTDEQGEAEREVQQLAQGHGGSEWQHQISSPES